jgi:hypothetical protein
MESAHSPESHHRNYVLTYDVASRLQAFRSRHIRVPRQNDVRFKNFQKLLLEKVEQALPEVSVHTIDMDELGRNIWEQVGHRIDHASDQVVLSTCSEIAIASQLASSSVKVEGRVLNINRLFNTDGEMMGYGPRPGFDPLDKQLDELVYKINGRSVILIEDGAFTGGTIRFVLQKLATHGLKVSTVIIGFCFPKAYSAIKEAFEGELVMVNQIEDLVDWIPDHDLVPFTPNCGRVLGEKTAEGFMPVQTAEGATCAYPYILPFGKMENWASLPTDGARTLSKFCLDIAVDLFSDVGKYSGHQVTIGDLMGSYPRVSIPIVLGAHENVPSLDMEVVSVLRQMRERLE